MVVWNENIEKLENYSKPRKSTLTFMGKEKSLSLAGFGSGKEYFILYESLIFLHSKAVFCLSRNDCMID